MDQIEKRKALFAFLVSLFFFTSGLNAQSRQPPPVIERVEPSTVRPGMRAELVGRHFRQDQRVLLNGIELPALSFMPNRVLVSIPESASTGKVQIKLPDGSAVEGPELIVLSPTPAPIITEITPTSGGAGTEVRIRGDGFSPRLVENRVTINRVPLLVRSATPTELVVVIPENASTGHIVVQVANAGEATSSQPFVVNQGLFISSVEPIQIAPGMRLVVRGGGFRQNMTKVLLNNINLPITSISESEIAAEVPRGARSGRITVEVEGQGRASSSQSVEVVAMPVVTSMEPREGTPGTLVRLLGSGFGNDIRRIRATIGSTPLIVRGVSEGEVQVEIPENASSGVISLMVGGVGPVNSPQAFEVLKPLSIDGFEPSSGPPGTVVTLRGSGFGSNPSQHRVTLQGVECPIVSVEANALRVRVPEANSGPFVVMRENANTFTTKQAFVVTRTLTIQRIEPTQGPVGTVVRILGSGFGNQSALVQVTLEDLRMEIRSLSDTEIQAVIPVGARSGRIRVNVRLQGTAVAPADFTVTSDFAATSVEPASAYGEQVLSIRGYGLDAEGIVVIFTGTRFPARVTYSSPNLLRVVVPEEAQSGPIALRLPNGRSVFTPTWTRLEGKAPIGVSEVVWNCAKRRCIGKIRGWGFGTRPSHQQVRLGDAPLRVLKATPTELEVALPSSGRGSITVTRGDQVAESPEVIEINQGGGRP
ncbi:MAG: IPT/TIG domain-containing protein [Sandaracinaceae bacterium]|nr:IPT/TIG domain-containing protein [Sandaracinaceae bacterium]